MSKMMWIVTVPCMAMRDAMARAIVGDDVMEVNPLSTRFSDLDICLHSIY